MFLNQDDNDTALVSIVFCLWVYCENKSVKTTKKYAQNVAHKQFLGCSIKMICFYNYKVVNTYTKPLREYGIFPPTYWKIAIALLSYWIITVERKLEINLTFKHFIVRRFGKA